MNPQNGSYQSAMESACLPEGDPVRRALTAKLPEMDPAARARWRAELALTDRLRDALNQAEPPMSDEAFQEKLLEKLLAIPAAREGRLPGRIIWRIAAAVVIVAAILGGIGYWQHVAAPPPLAALDAHVAQTLAAAAIKNHESAALEISSADPARVQKALAAHGMDFPVLMLEPSRSVALDGGGTCTIGNAQAVFTRWTGNGARYTLFEFNAADAGAPGAFLTDLESPRDLWQGNLHYRVLLWPGDGGKCCWALVMEDEHASNPFPIHDYAAPS